MWSDVMEKRYQAKRGSSQVHIGPQTVTFCGAKTVGGLRDYILHFSSFRDFPATFHKPATKHSADLFTVS